MEIQLNSSNEVEATSETTSWTEEEIRRSLRRFEPRLTRIEVHLSDNDGAKSGTLDKRCLIEARPKGLAPVAVSHDGDDIFAAITGAIGKLTTALDRQFGKLTGRKGH